MLKKIDLLERDIRIKNEYIDLIDAIGYDYDGCETSQDLKKLIDGLVDYARKAYRCDDTSPIYGMINRKFNILMEEIK